LSPSSSPGVVPGASPPRAGRSAAANYERRPWRPGNRLDPRGTDERPLRHSRLRRIPTDARRAPRRARHHAHRCGDEQFRLRERFCEHHRRRRPNALSVRAGKKRPDAVGHRECPRPGRSAGPIGRASRNASPTPCRAGTRRDLQADAGP